MPIEARLRVSLGCQERPGDLLNPHSRRDGVGVSRVSRHVSALLLEEALALELLPCS